MCVCVHVHVRVRVHVCELCVCVCSCVGVYELCLYMSHSVSQAQKAYSSLLLSPQYESHIKGSQYVLSRNVFYLCL